MTMDSDAADNNDTANYEMREYTLTDFFNDNHFGLMGLLLACAILRVVSSKTEPVYQGGYTRSTSQ